MKIAQNPADFAYQKFQPLSLASVPSALKQPLRQEFLGNNTCELEVSEAGFKQLRQGCSAKASWSVGGVSAFCVVVAFFSLKNNISLWRQSVNKQDLSQAGQYTAEKVNKRVIRSLISFTGASAYLLNWCHCAHVIILGVYESLVLRLAYTCTALLAAMSVKKKIESLLKHADKIKAAPEGAAREVLERDRNRKWLLVGANIGLCAWAVLNVAGLVNEVVLSVLLVGTSAFWLGSFAYPKERTKKLDPTTSELK